jgi:primary-amine oxidase
MSRRTLARMLLAGFLVSSLPPLAAAAAEAHPLDPLTFQEHFAVIEVLHAAGKVDAETRFTRIAVKEPDKAAVWAWKPGVKVPRAAEAVLRQGPAVFEAVVDLDARRLASWVERPGAQGMWLQGDFEHPVVETVLKDARVVEALKRRGVRDLHFVTCITLPPGNFGEPRYEGRRIGVLSCRERSGFRNTWARRIEGLVVVVDMHTREIVEVADDEAVPVQRGGSDFDPAALGPLREFAAPIEVRQPLGPGFTIDGHLVAWDRWRFHIRPDARVGTVLSTLVWRDGDDDRPVMYQGHLSEIFVPYMDPRGNWYSRTFIDAGEYSDGGLADSLTPGVDCPPHAVYVNGLVAEPQGWPKDKPRVACLFERSSGDMTWRHAGDGRPQRELVVRMVTLIGNYDYVMDWVFGTDGQVRVRVGATGIVETKMAEAATARAGTNGRERGDAYGRYVEPHVVAVNHDHHFNFRLDLDVDGPTNRLVRDALVQRRLPDDHPRRSIWVAESATVAREKDGQLSMDMHHPALWRVTGSRENAMGYPASYQLLPGHSAHTLLSPDDYARRRAGFIDHDLWVTPYAADERYAAGDYPTLSKAGEGLPAWTTANRPVADTDIVLWYTFGMHHMVRAEDWPVMPVLWHEFILRPFDFHDRNPALDTGMRP